MRKNNKKGFTLAELLIVVAIIAVLVAISIPIFTTQLEKASEGTDIANIRSAYAMAMSSAVAGDTESTKPAEVTVGSSTGGTTYSVKTPPAESTGAFDKVDVTGLNWLSGSLPSAVKDTPFVVTVTVASDGTATTAVTVAS